MAEWQEGAFQPGHGRDVENAGGKAGPDDNESDNNRSGNIIPAKSTWPTLLVVLITVSVAGRYETPTTTTGQ